MIVNKDNFYVVNKCNNTYYSIIKMKPVDVKLNTYIGSSREIDNNDFKLKTFHINRILKYKNIFANSFSQNWAEEVFLIKKVKKTLPWTCY